MIDNLLFGNPVKGVGFSRSTKPGAHYANGGQSFPPLETQRQIVAALDAERELGGVEQEADRDF